MSENLSKDGWWGGAETMKAVSLMHNVNILQINENETVYFVNGFNSGMKMTIVLAYRLNPFFGISPSSGGLRNHYDSVINIETENILRISELMAKKEMNRNDVEVIDLSD